MADFHFTREQRTEITRASQLTRQDGASQDFGVLEERFTEEMDAAVRAGVMTVEQREQAVFIGRVGVLPAEVRTTTVVERSASVGQTALTGTESSQLLLPPK